ncbi:MAG: hypothetical protein F6J89_17885 [Symploca sp. SIO1C4]|uniref:Uncharacterized protein n=1 Tax=Symploca sp. SIO1C4 TaxID=2607765 RepID=A0A6B3NIF7_9CYAN|nr:hypothetical protein [Symploca sp. SIO1C4]
MNEAKIISGFSQLLQDSNYSNSSLAKSWAQLDQTLGQLDNEQYSPFAKAIVDWCAQNQPLGDDLRKVTVISRSWIPEGSNRQEEELIKKNISIIREQVKEHAKQQQNPSQVSQTERNNNEK